jgi:hypothetical protein
MVACYSGGRAKRCPCKGVKRLDDVTGLGRLDDVTGFERDGQRSDEAEEHWEARALILLL